MRMVGLTELESVTSSMSTRHSNHLSYNPTSLKTSAIIIVAPRTVKKFFSASWKCVDELNFYVGEGVDKLNCEVFARSDELPLSERVWKTRDLLHL